MATFTWLPDYAPSPEQDIKVRRSVFGDGYEQRAESGINSIQPKWKLTFSKRTQLEAQAIQTWLTSNKAHVTAFNWAAPGEGVVSGETIMAGDGFRLTAQLTHLGRALTYTGTPTIYRTDWQGSQQLYPTARTNLAPYSQDLSGASWVKVNIGEATVTSPDGTNTGKLTTATASAATTLLHTGVVATSTTMAFSVFARTGGTRATVPFIPRNQTTTTNFQTGTFNTVTGAITGAGWTSTPVVGSPGWFRLSFVQASGITVGDAMRLYCGASGLSLTAGDSWITWGVQIEANAVTPYLPTGASAVTITDYTINASGLVTLAVAPVLNAVVMWSGTYTRKYIATWTPPTPEAFNSWSITAEFREVPA